MSVGILVGGVKSMELSINDQRIISIARGVAADDVPAVGWCSRSLWKPEHSFEGLLYRVGEHVIFADPDKGDTVVVLDSLFSVTINNDMVEIKGDHGQIRKACVLSFNLTRFTVNARFFVEEAFLSGQGMQAAKLDLDGDSGNLASLFSSRRNHEFCF